jgi:uncharacterized membrane protein (DUF106 family)
MKHLGYGFLAMVMTFLTEAQLTNAVDPAIMQQLINAVVSVVAGVLTGLLSKLLHKWFVDVNNQNQIANQNQTINQQQNTINQLQNQSTTNKMPQ